MKKITRILCGILLLSLLLCCTSCVRVESSLSEDELAFLTQRLKEYGYGSENIRADVVYGKNSVAEYMYAATDSGFVLYKRGTLKNDFCECGDGDPFAEYPTCKKYYEGVTVFCVDLPEGHYNITRQQFVG